MRIERVADAASDRVADYASLTDVSLRTATETERGLYIAESAKVIVEKKPNGLMWLRGAILPKSVKHT